MVLVLHLMKYISNFTNIFVGYNGLNRSAIGGWVKRSGTEKTEKTESNFRKTRN